MTYRTIALLLLVTGMPAVAQEHMTGMFRLSMTPAEVLGDQVATAMGDVIPADEALQWQAYVPLDYDSARPPGVFVYLDPNGWGGIPDNWIPVFNQRNLIWIGPRRTQAFNSAQQRVLMAVMSLRAVEAQYAIDLNRVYIGSSGNHAVTNLNAQLAANEFRGAVYIRGAAMWQSLEPDRLAQLQRKRHVFITGTNDEAKNEVRAAYEKYRKLGLENSKLIFATRRLGDMPDPEQIETALDYLDAR